MPSIKSILKIYFLQTNMNIMQMSDIHDLQAEIDLKPRTEKTQKEDPDQITELCSTYVMIKIQ
jgi:hypothetical protein